MAMEPKLSVCLIVKDEEKHLVRCLTSIAKAADEIIVVDTGSKDNTVQIAHQYTDKVFSVDWQDNFSDARNFTLSKATGDWVLFLDGDEALEMKSIPALKERINSTETEGYLIKVLNYYEHANKLEMAPDVVFRLFRNRKDYKYSGAIHEQICDNILAVNPRAKIEVAEDIYIYHYGYMKDEIKAKKKKERNTKLLEKEVQRTPDNLLNRFHLGVEYFRSGKIEKALGEFLIVLEKVNVRAVYAPKLMRYVAKCWYLMGKLEDSLKFVKETWKPHFPDQGDLYYLQGVICRELGRYAEAYNAFIQCLSISTQPAYYASLYWQYKDKIYFQIGQLAEYYMDKDAALEYYVEALKENPSAVHALERIIVILEPKKNPEYTLKALNTVFDLSDKSVQIDLGHIFFNQQAYELALQFFALAEAQGIVPEYVNLEKGLSLMRSKKFLPAIKELNKIPADSKFYVTAQGNLFLYYWIMGDSKKANQTLSNLKKTGRNLCLVEILEILRDRREIQAGELVNPPEALLPGVTEIIERLIELGEFMKMDEVLDSFRVLFPDSLNKLLGDFYLKYQLYHRALREYYLFVEGWKAEAEVEAEVYYRLGKACWGAGRLVEAEKHLSKALKEGYARPKVHWEMARLYQEMALETLAEGSSRYPDSSELKALQEQIEKGLIEV